MDYKEELINLVRLNKSVRKLQKEYFAAKKQNNFNAYSLLDQAKAQEKILDLKLKQLEDLLNNKPVQNDLFSLSDKAKNTITNSLTENVSHFLSTEERNKRRADAQKDYIEKRNNYLDGKPETINP